MSTPFGLQWVPHYSPNDKNGTDIRNSLGKLMGSTARPDVRTDYAAVINPETTLESKYPLEYDAINAILEWYVINE